MIGLLLVGAYILCAVGCLMVVGSLAETVRDAGRALGV